MTERDGYLAKAQENLRSATNDLAQGRATEIDALCGEVVRLARDHGIRAPVNERISELVRAWPNDPKPLSGAALRAALGV